MQFAMMTQMPMPIGLQEEQVPEQQFFNHQAVVAEIDISQGLRRVACEAACVLKEAMTAAQEAVSQLASILDFLEYIILTRDLGLKPGGTLEWDAARALTNINEVLDQQASGEPAQLPKNAVQLLQILQIRLRDLVILACSRNIEQSLFRSSGIPPELRCRLERVFGSDLRGDLSLWSCLGNSKWHIWNNGERFENRPDRIGRGPRKSRRLSLAEAMRDSATEGAVSAERSGAAGSCSDKPAVVKAGPAYVTTTVNWGDIKFN